MNDTELRFQCLREALAHTLDAEPETVVANAQKYYDFCMMQKVPQQAPAKQPIS